MPRSRRLRRLVPDQALFERRVAGDPLRDLAADYGVVHTTLSDFFRTPQGVLGLKEARRRLQAKRKARRVEEPLLVQEVRRRAREDKERDRWLAAAWRSSKRSRRSDYLDWLDARERPRGLTSRERYSINDDLAEKVAESGGGVEQVIEATPLRTREAVLRSIDPQIAERLLANDTKSPANARPDNQRLRRLEPNSELIRRRAAGETLRTLAAEYNVAHTTLSRYFRRPSVAKQLRAQQRRHRPTAKTR